MSGFMALKLLYLDIKYKRVNTKIIFTIIGQLLVIVVKWLPTHACTGNLNDYQLALACG